MKYELIIHGQPDGDDDDELFLKFPLKPKLYSHSMESDTPRGRSRPKKKSNALYKCLINF